MDIEKCGTDLRD